MDWIWILLVLFFLAPLFIEGISIGWKEQKTTEKPTQTLISLSKSSTNYEQSKEWWEEYDQLVLKLCMQKHHCKEMEALFFMQTEDPNSFSRIVNSRKIMM